MRVLSVIVTLMGTSLPAFPQTMTVGAINLGALSAHQLQRRYP